ncbi:MAG TPA: hypothetical protein VNM67_22165 [Thermoanaerobaculia bacterium]|nr:hypothetical protein [Thermoanaerobaculia bacterium]
MLKRRPSTHFATPHCSAQRWPRRTSMPSVFTTFVRGLQGERTPDADLFHDAWHGLRAALVGEMKKRGLWQSPPCYLGVYGWESWDSEVPQGSTRAQGALGELVADCYAFIFVDRLQSLKRQLQDKPEIDGLVLLNIRNFLHERQRAHDPLGFRIFEMLQAAVEDAVSSGALYVLAGDKKIRNDTFLGFDPAAELPSAPPDLEPIVLRWNDVLMPALVTARTRQQVAVVRRLRECLLGLPQLGIGAFRFKDLLDPLKRDARERWAALQAPALPGSTVESRQGFEHLTSCISTSIDRLEADARTRNQLMTLWRYLWRQHGEEGEETGPDEPSYRELGQRLRIPRERLPTLFALLRQLLPR